MFNYWRCASRSTRIATTLPTRSRRCVGSVRTGELAPPNSRWAPRYGPAPANDREQFDVGRAARRPDQLKRWVPCVPGDEAIGLEGGERAAPELVSLTQLAPWRPAESDASRERRGILAT